MKTLRKVPVTIEYVYTMPPYETFKEGVIYVSMRFGVSVHRCLCGCGEKTVLPLNNTIGGKDYGWKFIIEDHKATFTPSVGNFQMPCKSHYIITKGIANFV